MINLRTVKKICKDYTQIENYIEAVNDTTQTWYCHHILGEILSREQLLDHDFYYDVPPCMLKFVTRAKHNKIHKPNKGKTHSKEFKRKMSELHKGKQLSEETKRKLSESHKGKQWSEETKRKMSEAKKGHISAFKDHTHTEETRRKMSEAAKRRWARKNKI